MGSRKARKKFLKIEKFQFHEDATETPDRFRSPTDVGRFVVKGGAVGLGGGNGPSVQPSLSADRPFPRLCYHHWRIGSVRSNLTLLLVVYHKILIVFVVVLFVCVDFFCVLNDG